MTIKNILADVVTHTHQLGFLPLVKITGTSTQTSIESMADDRSVIMMATTHSPVGEFEGQFGMPNLDKLALHLKNPEYRSDARIEVSRGQRNGVEVATGLHFENAAGDFQNDYRFMSSEIINEKLKSVKFKGAAWEIEFEPSLAAIQRLKLQAAAHSEESVFQVRTENGNLVIFFGDASSHAGNFVFQHDVSGKLKHTWSWPVSQVQSILGLSGNMKIQISDAGAMQITVDSGIAEYKYILPALTK